MSEAAAPAPKPIGRPVPESAASPKPQRVQSNFEFWPRGLFYFPVIVHWLLLSLRYRSLTLPTLANPDFEAGGLCGESKTALFAKLGPDCRRWLAPYTSVRRSVTDAQREDDIERAFAAMREAGLEFPLIAKPDIGCQGAGVQLIPDAAHLARYLDGFPRGERLILQRWVGYEGEAGIFYVRHPAAPRGFIFSVTLKYFPCVTGDGSSSLEDLIRRDPRAGRIAEVYLSRYGAHRRRILVQGEIFRLVLTGNHCKGAIFRDGYQCLTPQLTAHFEQIARSIPEFHFGRFDLRFPSLSALQRGEFTIIEVNGAGSEATHIWDPDMELFEAYRTLFRQYELLFAIGAQNRARGFRPMRAVNLLRLYRRQQRLMAAYPLSH